MPNEDAETLWGLLDDIDTLSDAIKPSSEEGYKAFYDGALKTAEKRHDVLVSDGYLLHPKGTVLPPRTPHSPDPVDTGEQAN